MVHEKVLTECKQDLQGQVVSMCLDGWSNVHNEPIVCCSAVLPTGATYLVDTVDTSGSPHTAENLADLVKQGIRKCKSTFGAEVHSFVTDNASNIKRMREILKESEDADIDVIIYGCSVHLLNLLSADVEVPGVKENIVCVIKYFRNKQNPGTKLLVEQHLYYHRKFAGTLPSDSIRCYLKNRGILVQVCQDHKDAIDSTIFKIVNDVHVAFSMFVVASV